MGNQHTPKPWQVVTSPIGMVYVKDRHLPIAAALDIKEEQMANAFLMASAPELLEACEAALGVLAEPNANDPDHTDELARVIDLLHAAIAKAQVPPK